MTEFAIPGLMPINSPKFDVAPAFLELEPHSASATNWIGITSIGPITVNNEAPVYPASRVYMVFTPQYDPSSACVVFDSDVGADGIIQISSAETWFFEVPEQPLPLWPGLWKWEMHVVDSQDVRHPLYTGQILINP